MSCNRQILQKIQNIKQKNNSFFYSGKMFLFFWAVFKLSLFDLQLFLGVIYKLDFFEGFLKNCCV